MNFKLLIYIILLINIIINMMIDFDISPFFFVLINCLPTITMQIAKAIHI